MTSLRKIEANRRNTLKSTGPTTGHGKDRSRRNAIRHGLCAETVIVPLEDMEDYQAFEAAIVADFDAVTVVERELVLRLASLLWRLRRATAVETGLLEKHAELANGHDENSGLTAARDSFDATPAFSEHSQREITQCFLGLSGPDGLTFDRVSRYETALWRQLRQTLFTLKLLSWQRGAALRPQAKHAWWKPHL